MATLEVLDGPKKGLMLTLTRDEFIIGRLPYCDLALLQKSISRQHSRILRSGGKYFVEDMGSTNGTFINGHRISARTLLNDEDRVSIYDVNLLFRSEPQEVSRGVDDSVPTVVPQENRPPAVPGFAAIPHSLPNAGANENASGTGSVIDSAVPTASIGDSRSPERGRDNVRLRAILEINRELGSTLEVSRVLPKILDGLFKVFPQSVRGYILIPEAETGKLVVAAEKYTKDETFISSKLELGPVTAHVANRVLLQAEAVLSHDGVDGNDYELSDFVLDIPIRSMMCAPLIGPLQRPVGIIYVDTNSDSERFNAEDLDVLISVAASAGKAVEYADAHAKMLAGDRRERELAMAREVQLHFLPQTRPKIEGYQFFDYYRSAQEVGGDYYGYLKLPDGRLAITVGDVAGKGVTAALIMARLCSDVRYQLVTASSPEQAVAELNREFAKPASEFWFVTFILCVLDPIRHRLTFINAGHMMPILLRRGGRPEIIGVDEGGLPLGVDESKVHLPFELTLEVGDSILLYTDGINEAMNVADEMYGMPRMCDVLRKVPSDLERQCNHLLADVRQHTRGRLQNDDICLVGFQRTS